MQTRSARALGSQASEGVEDADRGSADGLRAELDRRHLPVRLAPQIPWTGVARSGVTGRRQGP